MNLPGFLLSGLGREGLGSTLAGMNKALVYVILGAEGSGRREVLVDLIGEGVPAGTEVHSFLHDGEKASPHDDKLGTLHRWEWTADHRIQAQCPATEGPIFFILNGRGNPVDQLEALRAWLRSSNAEVGRILCVVNCQLASTVPETLAWYDVCIHFSDVVLLSRRDGVPNKWFSEFRKRYEAECLPCLFDLVKAGKVKNPALILTPIARRISQAFDEQEGFDLGSLGDDVEFIDDAEEEEDEEEDEDGEESPEEDDDEPREDIYFQRRPGGRRVKEIPDITKYLPAE